MAILFNLPLDEVDRTLVVARAREGGGGPKLDLVPFESAESASPNACIVRVKVAAVEVRDLHRKTSAVWVLHTALGAELVEDDWSGEP